jgi:hypothetical protein
MKIIGIYQGGYIPVISFVVCIVDIVPVLGTGTVVIPWAIYSFVTGNIGFGIGLVFLFPIFGAILAFGKAVFRDGSYEKRGDDPISETIDSAAGFVSNAFNGTPKRDPDALEKLEKLKNLHDSGVLSDEEYQKMKEELMGRF